mmetsp:Transcript_7056/g.8102  ORF Transcript_7056/g.8102 Transcript_7056/m.8102 type:complete len:268 (-) Transcript_7056:157-960(-)
MCTAWWSASKERQFGLRHAGPVLLGPVLFCSTSSWSSWSRWSLTALVRSHRIFYNCRDSSSNFWCDDCSCAGSCDSLQLVDLFQIWALNPLFHCTVPVILDGVVRPARKDFSNFRPLVPELSVCRDESSILSFGPVIASDMRIQMVVPPFTTLLSDATRQVLRYHRPLLGTHFRYELQDDFVLLFCPWPLDESWVEDFLPAVETLDVGAVFEILGNLFPVLPLVMCNRPTQRLVLVWCPFTLRGASGWASSGSFDWWKTGGCNLSIL